MREVRPQGANNEVIPMLRSEAFNHPPPEMLSDQPPFLTVRQASKLLHVSTWALYQAIRSGELPVIRWGRRVVLQRDDLARLVASKRDAGLDNRTSRPPIVHETPRGAHGASNGRAQSFSA